MTLFHAIKTAAEHVGKVTVPTGIVIAIPLDIYTICVLQYRFN
jgi:hypothetical protein